jgi:hypothetical protein
MRCSRCPLFYSWNNESDRGESCGIFGEDWGNRFQYENKEATEIVGCYIEKAYIDKVEKERMAYYDRMAEDIGSLEADFEKFLEEVTE